MKFSYGVTNMRRIVDMPNIEMRPLTILIGRNSAGKSSFLRTFPLIKQSLITRTNAPVLWYGDYVDFGGFKSVVSNEDEDGKIAFKFHFDVLEGRLRPRAALKLSYLSRSVARSYHDIAVEYQVCSSNEKTHRSTLILRGIEGDDEFVFEFGRNLRGQMSYNGRDCLEFLGEFEVLNLDKSLFSVPKVVAKNKADRGSTWRVVPVEDLIFEFVKKRFRLLAPGNIGDDTVAYEARRFLLAPRQDRRSLSNLAKTSSTIGFKKLYTSLLEDRVNEKKRDVLTAHSIFNAFVALDFLEAELAEIFENVTYLGPARARSERYYRKQELEISEISPDGHNVPMFLASLPTSAREGFSSFVEQSFGYGVEVSNLEGHISVNIRSPAGKVNVADTGYGVSQLLPVLAQVWSALEAPRLRRTISGALSSVKSTGSAIVAIEQPELHLHPAHQSLLADVFVNAISQNYTTDDRSVSFLIETHSEALINKIGELIAAGESRFDNSDVQIVVFSAEDDIHSPTRVQIAEYDSDGVLQNWPYGFFNYS